MTVLASFQTAFSIITLQLDRACLPKKPFVKYHQWYGNERISMVPMNELESEERIELERLLRGVSTDTSQIFAI